jgi:hypothetical protein
MSTTSDHSPRQTGATLELFALWLRHGIVAAAFLLLGCSLYRLNWSGLAGGGPTAAAAGTGGARSFWPGVRLPPATAAAEAGVADDAEVIGVSVAGHARAYLLAAMQWPPSLHAVNDLLGGRAVSVTYCPISGCSRVFLAGPNDTPLELGVGLSAEAGMSLRVGGVEYDHQTGANLTQPGGQPIPYAGLPHARTTWGAWRAAHPDTDLYTGAPSPPAGPVTAF